METINVSEKMWRNIMLMLSDRGFIPDSPDYIEYSCFTTDRETTWTCMNTVEYPKKLVLYLLIEQPKLKNDKFTSLLKKYENSEFTHMIILTSKKEISTISDIIRNCKIIIQCINYKFFTCNVVRHHIQPKIRRIDYSEISMYGPLESFPKVLITDPVVVYYGFSLGDVIEYRRENGLYYRVVT